MNHSKELTPEKIDQNTKEKFLQKTSPEIAEISEGSAKKEETQDTADVTSEQNTAEKFSRMLLQDNGEFLCGMTNDYMFRGVLQKSPKALRSLAAAALGVKAEEITSCKIMNPIILGENVDAKSCILDIRAIINQEKLMNLEMQMWGLPNWPKRSVFYLCKMFTELEKGQDYSAAKPCVHIGFVKSSPFANPPTIENTDKKKRRKFVTRYKLMDAESGHVYTEDFSLALVDMSTLDSEIQAAEEMGKQTKKGARMLAETKELRNWVRLICAENWKEAMDVAKGSEAMQDAVVTMRELTAEEKFRYQCLARERYEGDIHSAISYGENAKSKRTAKNLSDMGLSLEKIAQALETSADTVKGWLDKKPQAAK